MNTYFKTHVKLSWSEKKRINEELEVDNINVEAKTLTLPRLSFILELIGLSGKDRAEIVAGLMFEKFTFNNPQRVTDYMMSITVVYLEAGWIEIRKMEPIK